MKCENDNYFDLILFMFHRVVRIMFSVDVLAYQRTAQIKGLSS